MAKRVGTISINIEAGTAKFIADMDVAKAKVQSFGAHSVSGVQAASGAIRVIEGNVQNNVRAVERFLVSTLKLGPVLQAAFPIVGAIAFGGMIFKIGEEVAEFFKKIRESPERIAGAFRELNAPLKSTNDQLLVTNDRLANDIAKLEGRRQNTLKLALDEARVAADKLADSLAKDLSHLNKLLQEENVGFMRRLFGEASTSDIKEQFGGKTGFGGLAGDVAEITKQGQDKIDAAIATNNLKAVEAARTELNIALLKRYGAELSVINEKLKTTQGLQREHDNPIYDPRMYSGGISGEREPTMSAVPDQAARLEELRGAQRAIQEQMRGVGLQGTNTDLTARKEALTAAASNAELDRPFKDRMNALNAQLDGINAKIRMIGESGANQAVAKGFELSLKAIEEVNKSLERQHSKLTDAEMGQISLRQQQIAAGEATATWRQKLDEATKKIQDQTKTQELLTAAIGKGREEARRAAVETHLMGLVGAEAYSDPSKQADIAKLRIGVDKQYDQRITTESQERIKGLKEQTSLERSLTEVQMQGAEAIRLVTLAYKLREMVHKSATAEEIKAEIDHYNSMRALVTSGEIATLNQKITAIKALAKAQIEGAEAARKAGLESKYAEMSKSMSPEVVNLERQHDVAQNAQMVAEEALKSAYIYKDQLESLDLQIAALEKIKEEGKTNQAIELKLLDLDNERLKVLVQQQLKMGSAKDGVKAFFLEMQTQAKRTSEIIYETLTSAVDRVSENLAKVITRQKADWGKMFKDLGEQMLQSQIKASLQKGLGAIGELFGIKAPKAAPKGTQNDPIWIRNADGSVPYGTAGATSPGGGGPGTVFGGSAGGFIFNMLGLTPHAGGGSVSPGSAYLVGEGGPELLLGASGRIASNSESRRMMGGGGPLYSIGYLDARGGDPVLTGQHVHNAIVAAHGSAVAAGAQMTAERMRRTPQHT